MEETTKTQEAQQEPKKLTYEEISQKFNDLYIQYQKLSKMYQQAMAAVQDKGFEAMSFYLQMLFKVMEHPNRYPEKFINWTVGNIQKLIIDLDAFVNPKPAKNDENPREEKGEAE